MRPIRFGYVAFTHSGSPSQVILLQIDFLPNSISQSYNPTLSGLGSSRFARRY